MQPYASVDAVIDTLTKADLSAGAVAAAEAAAHRPSPVTLPAPVTLAPPHQGAAAPGSSTANFVADNALIERYFFV